MNMNAMPQGEPRKAPNEDVKIVRPVQNERVADADAAYAREQVAAIKSEAQTADELVALKARLGMIEEEVAGAPDLEARKALIEEEIRQREEGLEDLDFTK